MKNYGLDRLLEDIGLTFENGMPDDFNGTLMYLLYSVNTSKNASRNVDMVMKYYFSEASMREIGENNGLSTESVRQIIGRVIRRLKYPSRLNILEIGLKDYYKSKITEERTNAFNQGFTKALNESKSDAEKRIDALNDVALEYSDVSVRLFNALYRAGYRTIGSVIWAGASEIRKVRNLGIKSYIELAETLITKYGEKREDWFSKREIEYMKRGKQIEKD